MSSQLDPSRPHTNKDINYIMDVAAIVASVGSFVVSERVIKAKATFLFGLTCIVSYDLFIHSNDAASLRVYRGMCKH